jgi:membrane protein CcdC involved in cytochrome C biogenesis
MKQIRIPSFLHDVFGEKQPIVSIVTILLFGALLTTALYFIYPEMTVDLPVWSSALALLLMFDIFSGCIANFTASTSNFYATRKTNRIVFIAIHVHIVLVAILLNTNIWYSIGVWAYTIAGAFIVNAFNGRQSQLFVASLLLSVGMGCMPMLPDIQPYMLTACLLFMLKVLFSFPVDHYGKVINNAGEEE